MPKLEDSSTRAWDAVAKDWVRHADENDYRNLILMPFTLEMLGDVRNARILDLGCGEGGYSRELAARGAKVVGVDGSAELIATATQRSAEVGYRIEFVCANVSDLQPLASNNFDIVLASMVLMDVEDYGRAIDEVWRVLAPDGQLLMSITHPCFSTPDSGWVRSEPGGKKHFAVDRYFERCAWEDFIMAMVFISLNFENLPPPPNISRGRSVLSNCSAFPIFCSCAGVGPLRDKRHRGFIATWVLPPFAVMVAAC